MSWNNAAVTNAGVALLNESLAGHILTITSAVGGAGTLEDQELASAVDVVDQKQTFCLMGLEDLEQGKQVGVQISNKGVSESYILHQIGVKAKLEYEEEETLLFLLQDDRGVEIPAEAENPDFLFEVYATIAISNKANITINVNPHVVASVEYVDRTFVKLTRKINGKDLSQDVTLTGEDIPVSEEDDTDLKTALENKVSLGHGEPIDASTDLDALTELGVYTFVRDSIPMNAPSELTDGGKVYVVAADSGSALRQTIVSAYGIEYRRTKTGPGEPWLSWVKTAIASPLKEIDLPVSVRTETKIAKYFKDQFGKVSFNIYITIGEALSDGSAIAVFPEGYKPSGTQNFVMSGLLVGTNTRFTGSFTVLNNGNMLLFESQRSLPAGSIVFGSGSFLAAE